MERYSISARTSLSAIDLLESRGLISKAEQGKKQWILAEPHNLARTLTHLLMIDGLASEGGEDTLQLLAYRRAWEEFGGTVQNLKFDFPS